MAAKKLCVCFPPASASFHVRALAAAAFVTGDGAPFVRPGERQVLINHAGHLFIRMYGGTMDVFKSELDAARRRGEIALTRADLAGAISVRDFTESLLTTRQGAEFHLIRVADGK